MSTPIDEFNPPASSSPTVSTDMEEQPTSLKGSEDVEGRDVDKDAVGEKVGAGIESLGREGRDKGGREEDAVAVKPLESSSVDASESGDEKANLETSVPVAVKGTVIGDGSENIPEERSSANENAVILTGGGNGKKMVPREGTLRQISIASSLRAEGASWKEVAVVMKRKSTHGIEKLPHRYPDLWAEGYKKAIQRVLTVGHSEAFLTLRRKLNDGDSKVAVQAARGILQHIERMTTKTVKHVGKIEHEHSIRRDGLEDMVGGGLEGLREQLVG